MKYVGLAIAFILVGAASFAGGFYGGTVYQQSMSIKEDKDNWEKNIAEIDDLIARQNQTMGVMMDTQIRIFHYAKPHSSPISFCPECFEIMQRAKKDPNAIEDEFKKLQGLPGTKKPETPSPSGKPNPPADSKRASDTKPAEPKPMTEAKPPATEPKTETKK